VVATRGSDLALAQTSLIVAQAQKVFPHLTFQIQVVKTTGDKLQTPELARLAQVSSKGLFTKELEVALLNRSADLAVHSLKDLPTELPEGLMVGAVPERADPRDVLVYRQTELLGAGTVNDAKVALLAIAPGAIIGTSSTRRQCQVLALRPEIQVAPIRGNVGTRLHKLARQPELGGLILAAAGLARLEFRILPDGQLRGPGVPEGLNAAYFSTDDMIPCVGQGALGIEVRTDDTAIEICQALNDEWTFGCVVAERAFLRGMGGGCLSPVAAYAQRTNASDLTLCATSFRQEKVFRAQETLPVEEAARLGEHLAATLRKLEAG